MHVDHNMHVIGCNVHVTCTLFRIGILLQVVMHTTEMSIQLLQQPVACTVLYRLSALLDSCRNSLKSCGHVVFVAQVSATYGSSALHLLNLQISL